MILKGLCYTALNTENIILRKYISTTENIYRKRRCQTVTSNVTFPRYLKDTVTYSSSLRLRLDSWESMWKFKSKKKMIPLVSLPTDQGWESDWIISCARHDFRTQSLTWLREQRPGWTSRRPWPPRRLVTPKNPSLPSKGSLSGHAVLPDHWRVRPDVAQSRMTMLQLMATGQVRDRYWGKIQKHIATTFIDQREVGKNNMATL